MFFMCSFVDGLLWGVELNYLCLNLAECTLRVCPFKAGSWSSMWCHKTCHCLLCDYKWGEPIENPNSTTQGTACHMLLNLLISSVVTILVLSLHSEFLLVSNAGCHWEALDMNYNGIHIFGVMGLLDSGHSFGGFDWWSSCAARKFSSINFVFLFFMFCRALWELLKLYLPALGMNEWCYKLLLWV